ncbi:hypothetical protein [Planctellipticum variicoloris]|uniref:hypothetical protein n=1 Tax=Planctellipticum variicoloris TaxID=3064265 RepID=UPI0030140110|nr:hypothetical protein SH412_002320 [Planctomycetaceae bacterium SH412]
MARLKFEGFPIAAGLDVMSHDRRTLLGGLADRQQPAADDEQNDREDPQRQLDSLWAGRLSLIRRPGCGTGRREHDEQNRRGEEGDGADQQPGSNQATFGGGQSVSRHDVKDGPGGEKVCGDDDRVAVGQHDGRGDPGGDAPQNLNHADDDDHAPESHDPQHPEIRFDRIPFVQETFHGNGIDPRQRGGHPETAEKVCIAGTVPRQAFGIIDVPEQTPQQERTGQ